MGLLDKIFGGEKTRDTIVGGVVEGVDEAFYTKEEKAARFEKYLELYHPFKLNQRVITWFVCGVYVPAWALVFVSEFLNREVSENVIRLLDGKMGEAFGYIVAFYFLGGALSGVATLARKNK